MSCAVGATNPAAHAAGVNTPSTAPAAPYDPSAWRGWEHHTIAERAQAIAALVAKHTTAQIGAMLGTTKNAVISAARRASIVIPARTGVFASAVAKEEQAKVRLEQVEKLKAELGSGCSVSIAAARVGIKKTRALNILRECGVSVSKTQKGKPRIKRPVGRAAREKIADTRRKNPMLTEAQQQNVDAMKARLWALSSYLRQLPLPTEDEAQRLVAEFIAKRGVTVCPPAASPETPHNALVKWK